VREKAVRVSDKSAGRQYPLRDRINQIHNPDAVVDFQKVIYLQMPANQLPKPEAAIYL
jgi:hypothetical protein